MMKAIVLTIGNSIFVQIVFSQSSSKKGQTLLENDYRYVYLNR